MTSEADLDADVKALSILSEHPELYADFAKLGCVSSLVSLLAHENTDIAIDAIEIIAEMTDEDVQAQQAQWDVLVTALLDADLPSLLVSNLDRMDEANDSDRTGVYHTLSLIENLASQPTLTDRFLDTPLLSYLLARLQKSESPVSQNTSYAAEILSILLQSSEKSALKAIELDAVDLLLQLLAAYRKRDPAKGSDEEEYVENTFNALTILVAETSGKRAFLAAEGIELCLIMLREGRFSKPRALRLLDHGLGGFATPELSSKLVDAAGLKTVFGLFMKQKTKSADFAATTEHVLGIFAALLSQLPGESPERIRLLAKFVEGEWEKVERLLNIREIYGKRVEPVEELIAQERAESTEEERAEREAEWQSRRLDAGLYSYQTSCVVLAWLMAEDAGARKYILNKLKDRRENLEDIKKVLQDLLEAVKTADDEDGMAATDMYTTLLDVLG
jgi:beta-catenin-like protein 1